MTKPGAGVAVIADPADSFRMTAQIQFPPPTSPLGAPWSKAVLSLAGDTCYVLGPAATGGLCAYDVGLASWSGPIVRAAAPPGFTSCPAGPCSRCGPKTRGSRFSLPASAQLERRTRTFTCRPSFSTAACRNPAPGGGTTVMTGYDTATRYTKPTHRRIVNSAWTRASGFATSLRRQLPTSSMTTPWRKAGAPGTAEAPTWAAFPRPDSPG